MEELINKFLTLDSSYGSGSSDGYGDGDGDGDGSGFGYGSGDGDGTGSGSGDGSGYGSGTGYGSGNGSGDGTGYGNGDGSGFGPGDGEGVSKYNGQKIHIIDGVQTIIINTRANYAKGYTLQSDLTLRSCFIARVGDYFAHGETLKEAVRDAQSKYNQNIPEGERIEMFVEQFESNKKYPAKMFFDWHNILTGSCEYGRREFCRERGINVDNDLLTVTDFFDLVKNSYGKDIIINLMSRY